MGVEAIVLIGHSNSGKTPLGDRIEQAGEAGFRRYPHLDFGEHLRAIASGRIRPAISDTDIAFIRSILDGTLLDDSHFYIVERILEWFQSLCEYNPETDALVLNGIPRHAGQARDLQRAGVNVRLVVYCQCSIETAGARKRYSEAGIGHESRTGRSDRSASIFRRRATQFETMTKPLIDYYRRMHVPVIRIPVSENTSPDEAFALVKPHLFFQTGAHA